MDRDDLISVLAFAAAPPEGVESEDLGMGMARFTFPKKIFSQVEEDLDSQGVRWSEE